MRVKEREHNSHHRTQKGVECKCAQVKRVRERKSNTTLDWLMLSSVDVKLKESKHGKNGPYDRDKS